MAASSRDRRRGRVAARPYRVLTMPVRCGLTSERSRPGAHPAAENDVGGKVSLGLCAAGDLLAATEET